jgi:hypothetical protein
LHHVVANWSQSKIAETVVNRHHDFVEKWTLNLAVGGIYNAVPLTKDRRPPCPPLPARRGVLRLLYHHVADHVIVPLGEALAGLGDPKKGSTLWEFGCHLKNCVLMFDSECSNSHQN